MISIVTPVLNEADALDSFLRQFNTATAGAELILVDGGSTDGTWEALAAAGKDTGLPVRVLCTEPQRARQMNAGARMARGSILLFLHIDTTLPAGGLDAVVDALRAAEVVGGRFEVRMTARGWQYRVVETGINLRNRLTGGFTGDQAIFVRRDLFQRLGGFPEMPLCEDIEFVRRLKRVGRLVRLTPPVTTSSRRYEQWGPFRTAVRMWVIKGLYLVGWPAERLATFYPDVR